jgi:hypothetical protein
MADGATATVIEAVTAGAWAADTAVHAAGYTTGIDVGDSGPSSLEHRIWISKERTGGMARLTRGWQVEPVPENFGWQVSALQ